MPPVPPEVPLPRQAADRPVNPAAMTPAELARALGVPEATIRRHLQEGAPRNAEGSVNLVHYAAWLNTPAPGSAPAPAPGSSEDDLIDG